MARALRARLPNGKLAGIVDDGEVSHIDVAAEADRLSRMLRKGNNVITDLERFVANVAPVIFPESDPARPARSNQMLGTHEVDIAFDLYGTDGLGIVDLKSPSHSSPRRAVESATNHLRRVLATVRQQSSIGYVITGRRADRNSVELPFEGPSALRIQLLSWDDILDRLSPAHNDADAGENSVILIETVAFCRRLLRAIVRNPSALAEINDRQFEELVATLMFDLGMQEVELTALRKDGGKDIIVRHRNRTSGNRLVYYVECKHWAVGKRVTAKCAISLLDVIAADKATGAILLSSSGFGPQLVEDSATFADSGVFLKDGTDLNKWISVWEKRYGSLLVQPLDPRLVFDLGLR